MRYCHECEAEVGPKATECGECAANLIGSTANSQGPAPSDGGGILDSLRNLFGGDDDKQASTEETTRASTATAADTTASASTTTLTDGTTLTDPAAFQHRSLGKQVLFTVLSLGFYTTYWCYVTNDQLDRGTDKELRPLARTLGLFAPPITFAVFWFMSDDLQGIADQSNIVLFVCAVFVPPAFWYFVQSGINDIAVKS
ncbi:DUF4234 domain-containing protein [Natranaeroarchaeum aerophilus]|uniref:DUF4234 domain-containing protein n=1 Tax=Natranaeroarchaeum aerophilus TaxID=2917711 RepID=A0AAE3K878_9EURY|nr:DUF4234 domain-containing protein [Natranaeroarchaeum aerophilus]MCL9814709.1 DUF4234 domain-containing protein [Natranaeroarchaeum aerophilus]